jgi:hypothetical protein
LKALIGPSILNSDLSQLASGLIFVFNRFRFIF